MAKARKSPKKSPPKKKAPARSKQAAPAARSKQAKAPTSKVLQAQARRILTEVLVQVLTTAPLRKKSGIVLSGKHEVSIGCDVDFLDTRQMRAVNKKYRKKDYATDVLSFPTPEIFRQQGMLGEVLICAPVLMEQARELGHSWKDELSALLVHGVLHLLDFDHERGPKDARAMQRWEERLLQAPGLISRSGRK